MNTSSLFQIKNQTDFERLALKTFQYQAEENRVYKAFISHLGIDIQEIQKVEQIPFMPISFFKEFEVKSGDFLPEVVFTSSGTTGSTPSRHLVKKHALYYQELDAGFAHFFGNYEDYRILPLLPSYAEREGSSLIDMVQHWIKRTGQKEQDFYLYNHQALYNQLTKWDAQNKKTILIGVSFALLDFVEAYSLNLKNTIVIETGGMKGRKKEITRQELHQQLKKGLGVSSILSEYGMTELLSQAYTQGGETFSCPPWMKIYLRETEDPFHFVPQGKTGGINVVDLANTHSCSFIATDDLGRIHPDGSFEVLGRFDHSDIRGCNLMAVDS